MPEHKQCNADEKNIKHVPLIDKKINLLPLYVNLGLVKNFVKAMDKEEKGFQYLLKQFPSLSYGKMKEGICGGSQIRHSMKGS